MAEDNIDSKSENLRGITDNSLKDERFKADKYLNNDKNSATISPEQIIETSRNKADSERDKMRSTHDQQIAESVDDADKNQKLVTKEIQRERKHSDIAQNLERKKEDAIHQRDRFKKRLIAEALFEEERKTTDKNLSGEREQFDLDTHESFALLDNERISHGITREALALRDQFLAIVSHDLRNPLGNITMSTSLLKDELENKSNKPENLLQLIGIIERSAASMDRMINDLLDVERITSSKLSLKIESHDICAVLKECEELFMPIMQDKEFTLTVDICPNSLDADFDRDRILQVLSNLIGNALKFTPKGGKITLAARNLGNEVEISVSDNGAGIAPEKVKNIFERYAQLSTNDRRGLGLGLYISKWIIEMHTGTIEVESTVGKGSKFKFTLPLQAKKH